jgi:hypothetical protein
MKITAATDADMVLMLECVYLTLAEDAAGGHGLTPEELRKRHTRRDFRRVLRALEDMKQHQEAHGLETSRAADQTIAYIYAHLL